jgi:hypothetical protein
VPGKATYHFIGTVLIRVVLGDIDRHGLTLFSLGPTVFESSGGSNPSGCTLFEFPLGVPIKPILGLLSAWWLGLFALDQCRGSCPDTGLAGIPNGHLNNTRVRGDIMRRYRLDENLNKVEMIDAVDGPEAERQPVTLQGILWTALTLLGFWIASI